MKLSGFGSQKMEDVGMPAFIFVMSIAVLSSIFISFLYQYFYQSHSTGSQVHRAFPLLGLSISAIFICIQFSLPLSLGLLGALSIVRFRTPIKEPEEIGFIMLVIASSIACATFNLAFLILLLLIASIAMTFLKWGPKILNKKFQDGIILITLNEDDYQENSEVLHTFLETNTHKGRMESLTKNGTQVIVSYHFSHPRKKALALFQTELQAIIGPADFNIYFNQTGMI